MNRSEHLAWCKARALEYVEVGDLERAVYSMFSNLAMHPETKNHIGIELGMILMISEQLKTQAQVIDFINGFN